MDERHNGSDDRVDQEFEEFMRQQYAEMNLPELRELARRDGKLMPDSASRWEVIDVLLGHFDPLTDPLTKHKEVFMHYIRENISFLSEALPCDGNCMAHPTELFLFCLVRSKQAKNHFTEIRSMYDNIPTGAGRPKKKRRT
jgi:hypothetical protein